VLAVGDSGGRPVAESSVGSSRTRPGRCPDLGEVFAELERGMAAFLARSDEREADGQA
jgi:hypothetical protein